MRKPALILAFFLSATVAACGGGGGGGGGTPATNPPPPTATPTATPTPTPIATSTPTTACASVPGAGLPLTGAATDPSGDWGPPAVATALNYPVDNGTPTWDGTGQTIAIVIDSDVSRSDLCTFFHDFSIPTTSRTITTRSVDLASGIAAGSSQDEATLDTEWAAALAPGANIIIYQIPDLTDKSITDAYQAIVSDHKAFIVNNSFGGCEGTAPPPEDTQILAGATAGITFTASSGDNGNLCNYPPATQANVGASWPASNPHVVGVGGTETWNGDPLTSNVVWKDSWCADCGGSGGVSTLYATPSYQTASILTACQSPPVGNKCSTSFRNEPDISFPAVDAAIVENGKYAAVAGTSWSSPEAAALYAELYQYCGANGGAIPGVKEPATFAYYVYNQAASDFIDVTAGNDQMAGLTPYYTALAGYDVASGLGVPKGWQFVQTACPGRVPPSTLVRTAMAATQSSEIPVHSGAYTTDVTPRVYDISDLGARDGQDPTGIVLSVNPNGDVAANEGAIVMALQQAGFSITQRFSNHLAVEASAPSSTVEAFFRTRMHNVSQGRYGIRYLPTTQIVVPASIAPYVAGISLDNVVKYHHRLERVPSFMAGLP
jgi:subtilase family serine protease